jgi:hypothetical protein
MIRMRTAQDVCQLHRNSNKKEFIAISLKSLSEFG